MAGLFPFQMRLLGYVRSWSVCYSPALFCECHWFKKSKSLSPAAPAVVHLAPHPGEGTLTGGDPESLRLGPQPGGPGNMCTKTEPDRAGERPRAVNPRSVLRFPGVGHGQQDPMDGCRG